MVISWTTRFIRDNNDEDTFVVYSGEADRKLRVSKWLSRSVKSPENTSSCLAAELISLNEKVLF